MIITERIFKCCNCQNQNPLRKRYFYQKQNKGMNYYMNNWVLNVYD